MNRSYKDDKHETLKTLMLRMGIAPVPFFIFLQSHGYKFVAYLYTDLLEIRRLISS
jgi:hypothetical protein